MSTFEVQLAVYDLSRGMARAMSQSILGQQIEGIWHTGIVVYGKEYYFGGGIQVTPWGVFASSNNMPPVEVKSLGRTGKTQGELETYLRSISHQFTAMTYDLITNNCNNFSDTVSKFLLGSGIPSYIVDLPRIVFSTPGGMMLRPMIESMQGNIRAQQGHGLDPFAAPQDAARFETTLSDSVMSLVMNMSQQAKKEVVKAQLEEKAFISADAGSISTLANKILNLSNGQEEKGAALSAEQKKIVQQIASSLSSPSAPTSPLTFSVQHYAVMEEIIAAHPEAHMACLFIIRLMFLHDKLTDYKQIKLVQAILSRLLSAEGGGFSTIPAHVMALCAMANLLSHDAGLSLLSDTEGKEEGQGQAVQSEELGNGLLDIILASLAHGRVEVRQMAASLAYNFTLSCTQKHSLSGLWKPSPTSPSPSDLHPQALQLLCACLEGLGDEQDSIVKKRKMSILCRLFRAYGQVASDLVKNLGLGENVLNIETDKMGKDDKLILEEIKSYVE